MSRLVVDIGNTNIAYSIFKAGKLYGPRRVLTSHINEASDLDEKLFELIDDVDYEVSEIVICCGVARIKNILQDLKTFENKHVFFISGSKTGGVKIKYKTPETLGPDRIANTIAAVHNYGSNVLVVDCGTAINIDLVDDEGCFAGGIISPGVETIRDSLCAAAPSLPKVEIISGVKLIGNSTEECIQSGVINGSIALINHVIHISKEEIEDLKIVLTGGNASIIFPEVVSNPILDEWFTLRGLGLAQED